MRLRWTKRALRDLFSIGEYIGRDNRLAALNWLDRIRERAGVITLHPLAGRVVPEFGREDIREVLLRSYRIVYLISDDTIDVLTVFEGHRLLESDSISADSG